MVEERLRCARDERRLRRGLALDLLRHGDSSVNTSTDRRTQQSKRSGRTHSLLKGGKGDAWNGEIGTKRDVESVRNNDKRTEKTRNDGVNREMKNGRATMKRREGGGSNVFVSHKQRKTCHVEQLSLSYFH